MFFSIQMGKGCREVAFLVFCHIAFVAQKKPPQMERLFALLGKTDA